jgi:hypothetical protein
MDNKLKLNFKNKTTVLFLISLALGITGIVLGQFYFDPDSLFYHIGEISKIGLLIACSILAVCGISNNSKRQIIKSILPSILLAIVIIILSSVVMELVSFTDWGSFINDIVLQLMMSVMATFAVATPYFWDYWFLVIPYWIVYIALLSGAVMFVRGKAIKHFPILGYLSIIVIAGIPFFLMHKLGVSIIEGIAFGLPMGR